MPRLYREAPLNSIWEGSGNVNALDVLRALPREPEALEAFLDEIDAAARRRAAAGRARHGAACATLGRPRAASRRAPAGWSSGMALALQGSLLVRHADPAVADAFCASRLAGDGGRAFGTLPPGAGHRAIVERHLPFQ